MAAIAGWIVACGGAEPEVGTSRVKRQTTEARGPVVAVVDGDPISVSEVQELVDATGLTPREALARLEDERLLALYAEQRGYGQDAASQRELKRARARALLAGAVEQGRAPADVSAAEVEKRFESIRQRDKRPPTRSVTHVLFKTEQGKSGESAKAAAEAFLREVRARTTLAEQSAMLDAMSAQGEQGSVPFVRESFDAAQDGKLEKPFADAVFELPGPGLLPRLAQTSYGYHVIVVRELKEPMVPQLATYETGIREQLALEQRKAALDALIEGLKLKDAVVPDEAFIKRALADDKLLGAAP